MNTTWMVDAFPKKGNRQQGTGQRQGWAAKGTANAQHQFQSECRNCGTVSLLVGVLKQDETQP